MYKNYKAVVLLSGGIDSAVTLGKVLESRPVKDVFCLIIDYNQKTRINELFAAKKICGHYGVDFSIIKIELPNRLNDKDALLPGRNAAFLSVACAFAESVKADTVYLGANLDDHKNYPDCRAEFVDQFNNLLRYADIEVRVHALLISLSKAGVISLGKEMGVPLELTWSCYRQGPKPCGKCDACKLKKEAYKKSVTFLEDISAN